MTYIPNELLSRLVGDRMCAITFVLNDYIQLRFDGKPGSGQQVTFNCYVWPVIESAGRIWRESDLGYADALRRLTPGTVTGTAEETGMGIRIVLDTGVIVIRPTLDEVYVEIAMLSGFDDRSWMVWRVGEFGFEYLA